MLDAIVLVKQRDGQTVERFVARLRDDGVDDAELRSFCQPCGHFSPS